MARLSTFLAAAAASLIGAAHAQDVPTPIFSSGSTSLSHDAGTGVKVAPDGSKVYITADDGSLVIADPATGAISNTIKPAGAAACNTGVSFSPDGTEVMYAVWTDGSGSSSQINAYSVADDSLAWSYPVAGNLAGAPMYGKDGMKVYFTWNDSEGHFTVLDINAGTASEQFSQSLTNINIGPPKGVNITDITSELTWSGVDVVFDPLRVQDIEDANGNPTGDYEIVSGGNYRYGEGNNNDLVVWAHLSPANARTNAAYYYVYQAPSLPTNPQEVVVLDNSGWAVLRRPVLAMSGLRMAVAGQRGLSRGWTQPSLLSQGANIKLNIKQNQRNGPNPSISTPSFTPDDAMMFFASTENAVYGVKADEPSPEDTDVTPAFLWERADFDSVVNAGTQPSPDSAYVFVLTSKGFAHKLNVQTGADEWAANQRAPGDVGADFDITTAGNMYFVTTDGQLNGWSVGGGVAEPTDPPTDAPTTMPVPDPTEAPTMMPVEPTEAPTTAPVPEDATDAPTGSPVEAEDTDMPTSMPVAVEPTEPPVATNDTAEPTEAPVEPPEEDTMEPTQSPVATNDTAEPTEAPVNMTNATMDPTKAPTYAPTDEPTPEPTDLPSSAGKASAGLVALIVGALSLMVL